MKTLAVATLVSGVAIGVLSAQQATPPAAAPPPVTFRAEVNYVEADAFVTDQRGRAVTDLTEDDFEIREDGKPQTIASFSLVNIPIERAERLPSAGTAIEPDVQTNDHVEGRIYLIVLDDLHTDPARAPRVKAAVRRFIEEDFGANDLAAIVFTGGRSTDAQDFTGSRRRLLAAVDQFTGSKLPSATIERASEFTQRGGGISTRDTSDQGADEDAAERARRARSVMKSIRTLAEYMARVRGRRKALLLVSEGVDYDIYDLIGPEFPSDKAGVQNGASAALAVVEDTRDAIAAATRADVNIYAIDPRGLSDGTADLVTLDHSIDQRVLDRELLRAQDSLRELAESTGGFAAVNQNDFNRAFDRIVRENSTYYLLGYYSTNDARDGKFRAIDLRVKRPGLMVRSRKGYVARKGKVPAAARPSADALSPAVADALASPLPVAGVPIRVYAAAFKGTPPNAAIPLVVELDVSKFAFVQQNGTYNDKIDIIYAATDSRSKVHPGERNTVNLPLKPETYERIRAGGLRVVTQANLPPGRYQIHVAAGDVSGKAGSVIYDLDVPDFSSAPLSLSGLALTSEAAAQAITMRAASKNGRKDLLPTAVTAMRDFRADDVVTVFGEVYENVPGAVHFVDIGTQLRDAGGRAVRNVAEQRSSSELGGKSGGYGFTARLPLTGVAPGVYVIHVEAQSRAASKPVASRDVEIRVR